MESGFVGASPSPSPSTALLGRSYETDLLDELIGQVRLGESRSLVLLGEAGIGKTALLDYVARAASEFSVVRAAGVESEMELAYAGLHQLCGPLLDHLKTIPAPQQEALGVAFGLCTGQAPDRFLVGLGALSLLSEAAEHAPLLCIVDDAQWLDRASALALSFVTRRLLAEPVGMVLAAREAGVALQHLPNVEVRGLRNDDALLLLNTSVRFKLDGPVQDRILAETRGNPLALRELPRGLSISELAGGFGLVSAHVLSARIEESYVRRLSALSDDARRLLILASADPTGDPLLLARAAERIGGISAAADEVEELIAIDQHVAFRHPLARSGVYGAASPDERREAHHALAEATDATLDPDRRAWHLADATAGHDEAVAQELVAAAERAQSRGGIAAAGAFLQRAVTLTPDPSLRAERALEAARIEVQAGALDVVDGLLRLADAGPPDELRRARGDLVRARLAFVSNRGNETAPLLLHAAARLEQIAPEFARASYLDALWAALFAGRLASPGGSVLDVTQAASAGTSPARTPADLFVDGLAISLSDGYADGLPTLREALTIFMDATPTAEGLPPLPLAFLVAAYVWDDRRLAEICERWVALCRQTGALSDLVIALSSRAMLSLFAGELLDAAALLEEIQKVTEAMGTTYSPYSAIAYLSFQGREAEAVPQIKAIIEGATTRGEGLRLAVSDWTTAVLNNGLGRYDLALIAAQRASEDRWALAFSNWATAEMIEAASRLGKLADTGAGADRLAEMARATQAPWALGLDARSRALLSDDDDEAAEGLYRDAIEIFDGTRLRTELARSHLLYGEWLRRESRRVDAREQLREAHEMFVDFGMEAFAERAGRELLATGEKVRKRVDHTRGQLTSQEQQIARLARDGLSNPEIGTQLFLSARTVEWHLAKVFAKLGIHSRRELAHVLPESVI